jgi:hypothetical protein
MDIDEKIAHLGFIQGAINRMGNNSFLVKGWTVALVAGLFALAAKDSRAAFVYIAIFPTLVFWILDCFYLREEQLFRKLYEGVADGTVNSDCFTMNTRMFECAVPPLWRTAFTRTVFPFYLLVFLILTVVAIATRAARP